LKDAEVKFKDAGIEIKCIMCGKTANSDVQFLVEHIDGNVYTFDKQDCITIFKKLKSVYGQEFDLEMQE
jgi:hypothetical protein